MVQLSDFKIVKLINTTYHKTLLTKCKFLHLGSSISNNGNCEVEFRRRINLVKSTMGQLTTVRNNRFITNTIKQDSSALSFSQFSCMALRHGRYSYLKIKRQMLLRCGREGNAPYSMNSVSNNCFHSTT